MISKNEADKPEKVRARIIEGRISKSLSNLCLLDQEFFLDPGMRCREYLRDNGAEVLRFVRYEVGERIVKKQDDFAGEVAAMAQK